MAWKLLCGIVVALSGNLGNVNAQVFSPGGFGFPGQTSGYEAGYGYEYGFGYGGVMGQGFNGQGFNNAFGMNPNLQPIGPPVAPPTWFRPPQSVIIDSSVEPNAPLPPATIALTHRRTETLLVEIVDRKQRQTIVQTEIPPGQRVDITLPRDAGGVVHETFQSFGPFGDVIEKRITRQIPVDVRYEVVVRRWAIQSIAIDRTGKSPSAVEDINVQGEGIGRFVLPAGPQLSDGEIDVFRNAVAAGNQGTVSPVQPPTPDDGPAMDPLRRVLEELNRR